MNPTANSALAAAHRRRSIRAFSDRPLPQAELRALLEGAGRAPSAWNLQPWRFVVVRAPETKSRLQAAAFGQKQVGAAPAVIAVTSDMADTLARNPQHAPHFAAMPAAERENWGHAQACIALGYLLLLAETMGLATSPMLGFDPAAVRQLFGLPGYVGVAALVAVGYAGEEGSAGPRLRVEETTRWL